MKQSQTGRRGFLKTVALASGAAGQAGAQQPAAGAAGAQPAAAKPGPARTDMQYPRTFTGRQLQMIAFPLGGVAAGSISLGGRGQLRDWEIYNRPDKGRSPNYAFPSIRVEAGGKSVARVLEARFQPPYEAARGLGPSNAPGLARLGAATFTAEYPMARIIFRDARLPVRVSLEAFSPFVPLDAEGSGLPVAVLRYKVSNPGPAPAKVSIAFSLDNPVSAEPAGRASVRQSRSSRVNTFRKGAGIEGFLMTNSAMAANSPEAGSFALSLMNVGDGRVTSLSGWPQAKWWASPLLFWDDFSADGALGPEAGERNSVASLCLGREIAPGAAADYTFLLSWHFPNRTPAGCGWSAPKGEENTVIGNHYATRFADAWAAAEHAAAALPALEKRMRQFMTAVRETTLPAPVKDAAMSNLSTLATNTCFRTADGVFRGFEGTDDQRGCCFGSCSHVWAYESATQFLFPSLARSMREAAFRAADAMDGVMPIRVLLPEGKQTSGTTAADGTMGHIIKTYLDWQLSGDDAWLRSMWPKVKKALEFAWVAGGWDGDRDGVMEGVQHNTYDVEFYGPNPMCGIYYLGGLRAAEEMARAAGDARSAEEYRRLFTRGSAWIDANLFNGEYYIQQIRGIPVEKIAQPLRSRGGAENPEQPDFQLGDGCLVDQLVGQFVASFAGLGSLVGEDRIRKTLGSIYRYNYKRDLFEHNSVQRIFAINDEAALVICDYGKGNRPKVPFPYFAEVMTGFEYSAAMLMLYYGMVKEGVECVENIRRRYDGERRNPFDEAECGHHYARAMASWTAVPALSGFEYLGSAKRLSVAPRIRSANFSSFWSTALGWGTFSRVVQGRRTRLSVSVLYGKLPLAAVAVESAGAGQSSARIGSRPVPHEVKREGARSVVVFPEAVEVAEGEPLTLVV